jgi:hypothetical protein
MEWQAVEGLIGGSLLEERPDARPNALVEVLQVLPDGTEFKAVWAYLKKSRKLRSWLQCTFLTDAPHGTNW